jgi:hypothetical protein
MGDEVAASRYEHTQEGVFDRREPKELIGGPRLMPSLVDAHRSD